MTWSIIPTPYGSVSFNGSTQYLSRTNNAAFNLPLSSGNFTVEAWIYITSYADSNVVYSVGGPGAPTTGRFLFSTNVTTGRLFFVITDTILLDTTGPIVPLNIWSHVALVRSGTTYTVWLNGASSVSAVTALDPVGGGDMRIGRGTATSTNYFNGYISNLRVAKGVAVYTGAFTPPSAPLFGTQSAGTNIAAITGTQTSLLLNTPNNASFIADSSANNFTVTNVGTATATALTPFTAAANTAWITTYNPFGSVSFNGSSQYLTTPANAALAPVTNFTVEAWIYANTLTSTNSSGVGIVFIGNSTSNNGRLQFSVGTDGTLTLYLRNNSAVDVTTVTSSAGSILIDTWYHVAGVRNGNNYTLYVNGNPVGTTTSATAMTYAANILNIGFMRQSNLLHYWNGYISNFRLTNGVAVYTGAFNVPRAPLQGIQPTGTTNISAITGTQTQLLLQTPNNASFLVDSSANNYTITNNGTATAAALTPFVNGGGAGWEFAGPENGSASFNGTSQYLTTPANAALSMGTGDFTWEMWIHPTTAPSGSTTLSNQMLFGYRSGSDTSPYLSYNNNSPTPGGGLAIGFFGDTTTFIQSSSPPALNAWNHIAVSRAGTSLRMFLNGVIVGSVTNSTNFSDASLRYIGAMNITAYYFPGYISNLRIVKGVAVYTSNFTPPIRQLPATQQANVYGVPSAAVTGTQTSLLLNTPNNSQNTLDSSTNNFAITNTGSVPPSGINPFVPDLGAVSFNGSTQYLTAAYALSLVQWWDTDYTIEMWIFNNTNAQSVTNGLPLQIAYGLPTVGTTYWSFGTNAAGNLYWYYFNGATVTNAVSTATVPLNSWNHVTMVYTNSNTTIKGYINGVQAFSVAKSGTPQAPAANTLNIGSVQNVRYNGYISNVRIVRGVAVYTEAFTPSTQPLPATQSANVYGNPSAAITGTQTSLLLNTPNNAQFIADSSTNDFTVTNNNAALATSLTPFSS